MTKPLDEEIDEDKLNPPPKKYVVSSTTKALFLVGFCVGICFYFYMIIERRLLQREYQLENQMAGVKLAPSGMPDVTVFDPTTLAKVDFKPHKTKWTLLNLWATWCPPCKEEMPSLEFLQQKYGHKLEIVALSVDENLEAIREFIIVQKPSFKVLWDKEQKAPNLFSVNKYPETFLISPAGVVSVQFSGQRDWAGDAAFDYFSRLLD